MRHFHLFTLVAVLLVAPSAVLAQAGAPPRPALPSAPRVQPQSGPQQSSPGIQMLQDMPDARATRNRLNEIFNQMPPSVREVLRIDPTLLYHPDYIGTYPALAAFVEQHPEVAHNPAFFIGERQFDERSDNPTTEAFRTVTRSVENLVTVMVIATITLGIIFLTRTLVEHRRWQRAMKAQNELQTKLIDRFSSSDDLIAYLQSPAGKALTEPVAMPQSAARPMNAPLSRIFWSLQSGIVVGALGLGLLLVSRSASNEEVHGVLHGLGIIVLTIGVGFALSAVVSYALSQRLGLVQSLSARVGGEAPGS